MDERSDNRIQATNPGDVRPFALLHEAPAVLPDKQRTQLAGTLFGLCVGVPLGSLSAAVCVWVAGIGEYTAEATVGGAGGGVIAGALVGFVERKVRGDLTKPDIATFLGAVLGLFPAAFVFLVAGNVLSLFLFAMMCAGPLGGMLVGAMFDRAYDAISQKAWSTFAGFMAAGIATCFGFVFLINEYSHPDPTEIANDTKSLMLDTWQNDPAMRKATIHRIKLVHQGKRVYTGEVDALLDGRSIVFHVDVFVRQEKIDAKWRPVR